MTMKSNKVTSIFIHLFFSYIYLMGIQITTKKLLLYGIKWVNTRNTEQSNTQKVHTIRYYFFIIYVGVE